MDVKISKHAKDLIQKYASGLFRDATLEFYGVKTARIKEIISVELPAVVVAGSVADFVFLLEDGTYLHFEFQSTYDEQDLIRFAEYDLRLYARDGRRIITVIIYADNVKKAGDGLNTGTFVYNPVKVMMRDYDGDAILKKLNAKIETGQEISDTDMLNLIFLPLMNNTVDKCELAIQSVRLAQSIPDTTKRNACIASAVAFAVNYLSEADMEKLKGVFGMFEKAAMFFDELIEDKVQEKVQEKMQEKMRDKMLEVAKTMLKEKVSVEFVSRHTGLDEAAVRKLQVELNEAV